MLRCVWLFCNLMDCSLPGHSVHGISQARILERVAISSSRGSSWPRDRIHVSCVVGGFFTIEPLYGSAFKTSGWFGAGSWNWGPDSLNVPTRPDSPSCPRVVWNHQRDVYIRLWSLRSPIRHCLCVCLTTFLQRPTTWIVLTRIMSRRCLTADVPVLLLLRLLKLYA